jgi:putative addiction module antidote
MPGCGSRDEENSIMTRLADVRALERTCGARRSSEADRASTLQRYNTRYNLVGGTAMKIKITTVGNSAGVILPKELLARLRLEKGDVLYATELPDGIKLTPFDPKLAKQMEVAERIMRKDRNVLRKLAAS